MDNWCFEYIDNYYKDADKGESNTYQAAVNHTVSHYIVKDHKYAN